MPTIQPFNYSVDLMQALLWQYNKSLNLQAIMAAKQAWYDDNQTAFWTNWVTDVFDLRTCNDFGCTVWAIILGIPISLIISPIANGKQPWGFDATNLTNFNNYNFSGSAPTPIALTTDEKRTILRLRYRQMTSRTTVPETNRILKACLSQYGVCYIQDNRDMTAVLVCKFIIPVVLRIIFSLDIVPRPAAVTLTILQSP